MIIQSIRLKNIKSYDEGPDGDGVRVLFQSGVNRIAGLNGHGKSTLIECLGYALFLAEPVFEENFKTETYFLRHGAKSGEIDLTFSLKGDTYRVERGLGAQSKRRTKVVQVSDGSICAEGDKEVADFLCRLLDVAPAGRLTELFAKLVGVKQGRLTWPFDSKSGEARKFFEPLLEVEIFRQCFDRLKPTVDGFKEQSQAQEVAKASVEERIRERADSKQKLSEAQDLVIELLETVKKAEKAREEAETEKKKQEGLEKAVTDAETESDKADTAAKNAKEKREDAEKRVKEAEDADQAVAKTGPGHDAYAAAEEALKKLEAERRERDELKGKRDKAEGDRKDRESKASAARQQKEVFSKQQGEKQTQKDGLDKTIDSLETELKGSQESFNRGQQEAEKARENQGTVKAWVQGLPGTVERLKKGAEEIARLDKELSGWKPKEIDDAREAEKLADEARKKAEEKLTQARERRNALSEQLKEIGTGVCPFLKEKCQQFDPAKVEGDLADLDEKIVELEEASKKAKEEHRAGKRELEPLVKAEDQRPDKQKRQAETITDYGKEFKALVPSEIPEAVSELRAWHGGIESCPKVPALPDGELTAGHVPSLQQQAEKLKDDASTWWDKAKSRIDGRLKESETARTERTGKETQLAGHREQRSKLEGEIKGLGESAKEKGEEAERYDAEAEGFKKAVEELDEKLKPYAEIDGKIDAQKKLQDTNKADHERYLSSKKLAEDLSSRRDKLKEALEKEEERNKDLQVKQEALKKAQEAFDPKELRKAQDDFKEKLSAATTAKNELTHAEEELIRQARRFKELNEACDLLAGILMRIERLEAQIELTELARTILKNAAPSVAQHLCNRIAARAQTIFNRINPDPVELAWKSENYSLKITPGDRHFAMLSGGEQTKLALAMTLAMVEEFSGLRFCIFDEPTYGVDADSRRKLADAILEAQEAAGLEQLLLVSHDDAFEGKIEHSILLQKSAAHGTAVASAAG